MTELTRPLDADPPRPQLVISKSLTSIQLDESDATPRPPPMRKTYGKKRYMTDRENPEGAVPAKKSRATISGPTQPAPPTPLRNVAVNTPRRLGSSTRGSPHKSTTQRVSRGVQNEAALDSPFMEPRNPDRALSVLGNPLRRPPSLRKSNPSNRSRHLSLNRVNSNRGPKETSTETLRRKTSEATTTLSSTPTEHSWLRPPPPRAPPSQDYRKADSALDFSFYPPAESTLAHAPRLVRTPPSGTAGNPLNVLGSDETPAVRRRSLYDEMTAARGHKVKRHDSILSTDSEDFGTSLSIFGLTPKPRLVDAFPKHLDSTSGHQLPLIEQLCASRSRSSSVSIRPLARDISSIMPSHSSSDADNEMVDAPQQDPSVRALAEACAELNIGQDPSPSRLVKAASRQAQIRRAMKNKRGLYPDQLQQARDSGKPYQLSPRTVQTLSLRRRVGMRIEARPLSPDDDVDTFASYEFDRGTKKYT